MKNYAIARIQKHSAGSTSTYLVNHHLRLVEVENADPEKAHLNKLLYKVDNINKFLNTVPCGTKSNATKFVDLLFSASRFDSKEQLDQWVKSTMEFAKEEFLEKNIAMAILHNDETTPHIHIIFKPVNPKTNKLGAGHWFDGSAKMKSYQDRYFAKVKHLGFDRGTPGSRTKHKKVKTFYKNVKNAQAQTVDIHKELGKIEATLKSTNFLDVIKNKLSGVSIFETLKPIFGNLSKQVRAIAIQAEINQTAKKTEEAKKLADKVAFLEMKLKDLTGSENPSLAKIAEVQKAVAHFKVDLPKKAEPLLEEAKPPTATQQQKSKLKL